MYNHNPPLLEEVFQAVDTALKDIGLSDITISRYRQFGFSCFHDYFAASGCEHYSEGLSQSLVLEFYQKTVNGEESMRDFRMIRKLHEMMKDFSDMGYIPYRDLPFWKIQHPDESLNSLMDPFFEMQRSHGVSELTIRTETSTIRQFLLYIELAGIKSIEGLRQELVEKYVYVLHEKWLSGIATPISSLRCFLSFLYSEGRTERDLSVVLQVRSSSKERIKSGFSVEEENKIISAINRDTPLGKRDYAMVILAMHTGLRQIDVLNLKLQDIRWREAEIHIVQRKTNKQLILPLDQSTGDAIAEYILHGRPQSSSEFVFLRSVAPYTNLKVGSCIGSRIIQKYAERAGVTWSDTERKGFHSLRRSLGREMLSNGVPLHTISEVLGHSKCDSTKPYLAIDVKHLRDCNLPLNGIECGKEEFI